MSKHLHFLIIERARTYIANPATWTKGWEAVNRHRLPVEPSSPEARRFCAIGALERAAFDLRGCADRKNADLAMEAADLLTELPIDEVNDGRSGRKRVLQIFDACCELVEHRTGSRSPAIPSGAELHHMCDLFAGSTVLSARPRFLTNVPCR